MTTDKNGIEICCANCCDIECGGKGACGGLKFIPSIDALEARIDDLQSRYGYAKKALALYAEERNPSKPRAKRLVWRETRINKEWNAEIESLNIAIIPEGETFIVWLADTELNIPSFDTLDEAEQAAQEWLDKLVEECAEYDDKNHQKQVSTTNGTCESEAQNG